MFSVVIRRPMGWNLIDAFARLEEREEEAQPVDERDEPDHRRTFDAACAELGLGANADDNARREQVAKVILELAQQGERDPIALQQYAVRMMQGGV
jgi:hypothetical protein